MKCLWCENECDLKDNTDFSKNHRWEFGIDIPKVELWTCDSCNKGVGYVDGILFFAGECVIPFERVEIPIGCLAVFDMGDVI